MRYLVLLGIVFLGGCLTRTYVVEKPRTNLEIPQGANRGYLEGSAPAAPASNKFGDKRKISILEVELGPHERKPQTKMQVKQELAIPQAPSQSVATPSQEFQEPQVSNVSYQEYVVQKADTLQKISEKFYGTTKKWQMLYEENKETLKSPDKVYPGLKLKIPNAK